MFFVAPKTAYFQLEKNPFITASGKKKESHASLYAMRYN